MEHDAETLAYCAGVIDSDGCIFAARQGGRDYVKGRRASGASYVRRSYTLYMEKVQVGQVETEAVELLRELFGGSITVRNRKNKKHKTFYVWRIQQVKAHSALMLLLPHLRIKRRQAENVLRLRPIIEASKSANRTLPGKSGTQPRDPRFTQAMEIVYAESRRLNGSVLDAQLAKLIGKKIDLSFVSAKRRVEPQRQTRGRLQPSDVRRMRKEYAKGGVSYEDMGKAFSVAASTAWNAITGRTFADVA